MVRRCVISSPSQLTSKELGRWSEIQGHSPHLHRAFFSPAFALACERAGFDTRIAVIRQGDRIEAIFPFQYRDRLNKLAGLAEQIGGHLSDSAGIIAEPGWRTSAAELVDLCGLGAVHINCLAQGQPDFGLESYEMVPNFIVDLSQGLESYFEELRSRNPDFVRDTGRRFRRATRAMGSLATRSSGAVAPEALSRLVSHKRAQYKRTNAEDVLGDARAIRVLEELAAQNRGDCRVFHTALEAEGKVIAEHFGLLYLDVLSYWLPVYDFEYQQYSPGRLMLWELIKEAPQSGIKIIDFGEGESQYKRQFSNKSISSYKAWWKAGNARSLLAEACQSSRWYAASLQRKMRAMPSSS
jgi:CelD/BcsL family acetyltransferase involved in cellulose biosynthesis